MVDVALLSFLLFIGGVAFESILDPSLRFVAAPPPSLDYVMTDDDLVDGVRLLSVVLSGAYFVVPWTRWRSTPGQRLLGLEVREFGGDVLGVLRGLARWLALGAPLWVAMSVIPGVIGLAALFAAYGWSLWLMVSVARDPEGVGLHDRLSGTRVIAAAQPVGAAGWSRLSVAVGARGTWRNRVR